MILETFKVGPEECNCSILACSDSKHAVVVDPGGNSEEIMARIKALGLTVRFILITHAHFDHVLAARDIKEQTGAKVCLHRKDIWLYRIMPIQYRMFGIAGRRPPRPDFLFEGGERVAVGSLTADVMHTPGHSPGGCCFHLPDQKLLFSGDTLFSGSIGRTDFPGGRYEPLITSITEKLLSLPDDTRVIPGHHEETTIGHERLHNPFLQPDAMAAMRIKHANEPGVLKSLWLTLLEAVGLRKVK